MLPSGCAVQAEHPNHRKLRRSRAGVVSGAGKGPLSAGEWSETASIEGAPLWMREPRMWGVSVSRSGEIQVSVTNAGAILDEVAQLMRHASPATTFGDAEINEKRLALSARPWPDAGETR